MKYFPNYLTTLPFSVSASIASQSLFLNNFASTPVDTASLALNITGSRGASGTSVTVIGDKGPRGFTGFTGPAGTGIYLLPATRTYCACNIQVGREASDIGGGVYDCTSAPETTYYSNCGTIADACVLYIDLACTSTVTNGLYTFGNLVYSTTSGVLTEISTCGT
jgi:hypothetical protein